jgi:tRNA-splicing ligase RtcB
LEIQKVDKIFNKEAAEKFGLFENQVTIMIHTGSRGLGHQVATDYIRKFLGLMNKYQIKVPDKEFACVPFNSPDGQDYFTAMAAAANYAWANRAMIAYYTRLAWQKIIGQRSDLKPLYDVAHNIIKIEEYEINNKKLKLAVHRKGATRSFPPNHPEIPNKYQTIGQPVLIPGSMGTASYVLVGTFQAKESFYSTAHGSGRTMSRHQALKNVSSEELVANLKKRGIIIKSASFKGLAEEAPVAYKDIEEVIEVVHQAGLSEKVARLVPLAVIKGE